MCVQRIFSECSSNILQLTLQICCKATILQFHCTLQMCDKKCLRTHIIELISINLGSVQFYISKLDGFLIVVKKLCLIRRKYFFIRSSISRAPADSINFGTLCQYIATQVAKLSCNYVAKLYRRSLVLLFHGKTFATKSQLSCHFVTKLVTTFWQAWGRLKTAYCCFAAKHFSLLCICIQ